MFKLFNKKFIAFTLAEVLMISGIVAVVATLTVPNLQKGYNTKALKTGAQATFSKLEAALSAIDVNDTIRSESASSVELARKLMGAMAENLKLQSYCDSNTGCFADTIKDKTGNTSISASDAKRSNGVSAILSDGSAVSLCPSYKAIFDIDKVVGYEKADIIATIYIDANGPVKEPNQIGQDIFIAIIVGDSLYWSPDVNPDCDFSQYKS